MPLTTGPPSAPTVPTAQPFSFGNAFKAPTTTGTFNTTATPAQTSMFVPPAAPTSSPGFGAAKTSVFGSAPTVASSFGSIKAPAFGTQQPAASTSGVATTTAFGAGATAQSAAPFGSFTSAFGAQKPASSFGTGQTFGAKPAFGFGATTTGAGLTQGLTSMTNIQAAIQKIDQNDLEAAAKLKPSSLISSAPLSVQNLVQEIDNKQKEVSDDAQQLAKSIADNNKLHAAIQKEYEEIVALMTNLETAQMTTESTLRDLAGSFNEDKAIVDAYTTNQLTAENVDHFWMHKLNKIREMYTLTMNQLEYLSLISTGRIMPGPAMSDTKALRISCIKDLYECLERLFEDTKKIEIRLSLM